VLEAAADDSHGLGMATVNAGVMFFSEGPARSARCSSTRWSRHRRTMNILQIDWLQPIYT
jgi:hypothetical protein